jgi:LmbE family N-acetylglucosaminyl deacetylase
MVTFLSKKLLFVVAHPDDESFTAAGTMWQNHKKGGKNYIFCATKGERGKGHFTKPVSQKKLKQIRRAEITKAAKFLKVDGLFFGGLPDTKVKQHSKQLAEKVGTLIKRLKPDYIFSFGPDGISGHMDHIAAGQAAKQTAQKFHLPFVAFAASPAVRKNFKYIKARRRHGKYASSIRHALPNLQIKVDAKIKGKTLGFHKSQAGPSTLAGSFVRPVKNSFLNYEYFII